MHAADPQAVAAAAGTSPPFRNRLLAALGPGDLKLLRPHLTDPVELVQNQLLQERGHPVQNVFFPETGLVSLAVEAPDNSGAGGAVEVGITGREGLVGASVLLDPEPQAPGLYQAFVQIPGAAWRVPARALRSAVDQSPALRERLLRYVQFLVAQSAQAAACNARHEVPKRLARWLLMAHDRVDGNELALRQEAIALMLGVRREGVSVATGALEGASLIRHTRGRIAILDRGGLERAACGCYRAVRDSEQRILARQQ